MLLSASVYSPPDDRGEVKIQGVARVASSKIRRLAFWGRPCPHAPLLAPVGSSRGPTGVSVTSTLHCRRLFVACSLLSHRRDTTAPALARAGVVSTRVARWVRLCLSTAVPLAAVESLSQFRLKAVCEFAELAASVTTVPLRARLASALRRSVGVVYLAPQSR